MDCNIRNRNHLITDYLTGELSEKEMAAFEEHYFGCRDCFQELRLAEDAVNLIGKEGPEVLAIPDSWRSKILKTLAKPFTGKPQVRPRWRFAAVAIAALALLIIIALPLGILKSPDKAPSLASFLPSPNLDGLVGQTYQSGYIISNILPANDATIEEGDLFKWQIEENGVEYKALLHLRILDNKDEELFRFTVAGGQFRLNEELAPGLYYWALLTESEMVYIGRFYVKR